MREIESRGKNLFKNFGERKEQWQKMEQRPGKEKFILIGINFSG